MNNVTKRIISIVKTLVVAYLVTALMLLILTVFLYKLQISGKIISIGIIVTYVLANLVGGLIIGKVTENKKYVWGCVTGVAYFLILSLLSFIINKSFYGAGGTEAITALACCGLGGMLGGMIS